MKAETMHLGLLFKPDVRYLIPTFQRRYVWTRRNQWDPLWEDVRGTAECYLDEQGKAGLGNDGVASDRTPAHFLGAIVIQLQQEMPNEIPRWLVIDGQQRLMTLQLLLDAAQEVTESLELSPAMWLSKLVLNDKDMLGGQQDRAFKVWPTLADQDAFRHAMHNGLPSGEYKNSNIVEAHEFFKLQVREWIQYTLADQEQRALALQMAITQKLNLVVISLDRDESPHIIFETLNARGTALLQADLVKNFILYEAGVRREDPNAIHKDYLRKLEEKWWQEKVAGRIVRPRVDIFLNYWIIMQKQAEVPASDVFSTVREYAKGKSVTSIAFDISRLSDIYREIQNIRDDSVLGRFLYRRRVMQMGVLTPVLMWLRDAKIADEKEQRCLRIIESYLVRRMVCRMSTRGYYNLFLDLLKELGKNEKLKNDPTATNTPMAADELIKKFFADQTDALLWPSDREVENAFVDKRLFHLLTRGRLRLVLEGIEGQLRDPKTEDTRVPRNLTIEHVMPQGWHDAGWPSPQPSPDPTEDAEERRERLIHTIGNLTLLTKPLNSRLSNGPWLDKRDGKDGMEGLRRSVLQLNNDLVNAGDVWNEDVIMARSRRLAEVAAEVWPHADRI